jgi:hypothetical protein
MTVPKPQRKPGKSGPATSRLIYPKPPLRGFTTAVCARKPKPPERTLKARFDWGLGAVCCGASPVASALDLPQERDFPKNRIHTTTHPPVEPVEQDISTWQGIGPFYLALTRGLAAGIGPTFTTSERVQRRRLPFADLSLASP